mgnify:CR=1 FL=1
MSIESGQEPAELPGHDRHALTETELLSLRSSGRRLTAEQTERLYELEHHPACPDCGAWGKHECPAKKAL